MIGLTTGLVMAFTAFGSGANHSSALILSEAMRPSLVTVEGAQGIALADTFPAEPTTEEIVREYFKDTPALAEIAKCESTFRQFDKKGNVLRGIVNSADVGVMQINEFYHLKTATKLGMDLHTIEGNMAFGKYLYDKNGTSDWNASKPCWGKRV